MTPTQNHFRKNLAIVLAGTALGCILLFLGTFSPNIDLLRRPLQVNDQTQPADVVVAISAGLITTCNPQKELLDREYRASELLQKEYSRSGYIIFSGQYTDPAKLSLKQCQSMLAERFKIPASRILLDNQAYSTYDNAVNVKKMMQQRNWQSVLLVTSNSHMWRAKRVFEHQGIHVYPSIIADQPDPGSTWFNWNRVEHIHRFLYEYGAILFYQWYGYL